MSTLHAVGTSLAYRKSTWAIALALPVFAVGLAGLGASGSSLNAFALAAVAIEAFVLGRGRPAARGRVWVAPAPFRSRNPYPSRVV